MTAAPESTLPDTEAASTCTKCSGPLDTTGNPHWCKGCRARYKRDYETTIKDMNFCKGVAAMRIYLAENFEKLGSSSYTGREIADIIRGVNAPRTTAPES